MSSCHEHRRITRSGTKGVLEHALLGVLPVLFTGFGLAWYARHGTLAIDFHRQYWVVGNRIVHGLSPYDRSWQDLAGGIGFPYPAPAGLWFVPLALLPHGAADWLIALIDIGALLATLRIAGVRDWRIYGIVLLWAPVVSGWQTANISLLLGLAIALAWRHRDRPVIAGALIGAAISTKLVAWPIAIWLLATKRYRAFGWAVAAGIACNAVAWAVVGFDQIPSYIDLSRDVARIDASRAYNLVHLLLGAGLGVTASYIVQLVVVCCVAWPTIRLGRSGQERSAFTLSVAAVLLAAPVIWLHYFALLVLPLAVTVPRIGPVWALPIALYACPVHEPSTWQLLGTMGVATLVILTALRTTGTIAAGTTGGAETGRGDVQRRSMSPLPRPHRP